MTTDLPVFCSCAKHLNMDAVKQMLIRIAEVQRYRRRQPAKQYWPIRRASNTVIMPIRGKPQWPEQCNYTTPTNHTLLNMHTITITQGRWMGARRCIHGDHPERRHFDTVSFSLLELLCIFCYTACINAFQHFSWLQGRRQTNYILHRRCRSLTDIMT